MGAVWLAQDTRLEVPCAVKFILPEKALAATIRVRFAREAKAAAQLRSPHVVQILDHGIWQDAPYIAMEYLEGEDLAHRLGRRKTLSPGETAAIATQVGRALTKARAAGLVHRDLKPENIFLVRDDGRDLVKVLDFGIAKAPRTTTDNATKTGALLGTPAYMSPEQVMGEKGIDHRSDLWALGVVVYQCLTGKLPFESEVLHVVFTKILTGPIPVPSSVATVPPAFDAWWLRAVARDRAERFQSATEMTDGLDAALGLSAVVSPGGSRASPASNGVAPTEVMPAATAAETVSPLAPTAPMCPPTMPLPAPTELEPALPARTPRKPNRVPLAPVALVGGVVAVGGLMVLLSQRSSRPPAAAMRAAPPPSSSAPMVVAVTPSVAAEMPSPPIPTRPVVLVARPPRNTGSTQAHPQDAPSEPTRSHGTAKPNPALQTPRGDLQAPRAPGMDPAPDP
jgi:serine/threonine-protein kinase